MVDNHCHLLIFIGSSFPVCLCSPSHLTHSQNTFKSIIKVKAMHALMMRIDQKVGGIRDDRDWYFWQHRH